MKECRKCKTKKALSEYYIHTRMADNHLNICKDCTKRRVSNYSKTEKGRENDRKRHRSKKRQEWIKAYTEKNRKRINETRRRWASKNPDSIKQSRVKAYAKFMSDDEKRVEYNKRKYKQRKEKWETVKGYYRKTLKNALKDPERKQKIYSRSRLSRAKKSGKIEVRPCSVCGDTKVQGHHKDYDKPLEVVWLCDKHHRELHGGHGKGE